MVMFLVQQKIYCLNSIGEPKIISQAHRPKTDTPNENKASIEASKIIYENHQSFTMIEAALLMANLTANVKQYIKLYLLHIKQVINHQIHQNQGHK